MSDLHINCPHFRICSGCTRDEYVDHLPLLEEARQFFIDNGSPSFSLQTGNPIGWRCRAKLAVRGTYAEPLIGLFERGTHQTINIPFCRVHHPSINQAVEILRNWMKQCRVEPYDEVTHRGVIRYVQACVEKKTGRIQLVLVINAKQIEGALKQDLELLRQAAPELWHSLWVNLNTRHDNIIFGDEWISVCGSVWLWETLNEQQVCFHPASFMQANLEMFERLLERIEMILPQDADLIEFYAGVGAIGTAIVEKCKKIQCIELNPTAQQCFEETRRHLPIHLAKRLTYHKGKSADYMHLLKSVETGKGVVLVDPPRKGLEKELLKALCNNKDVNNIIYISCGWIAFQRDCQALLEAGWRLVFTEAYLFFPGSEHIEVLAVFKNV